MGFWDFFRKADKGKEETENEKVSIGELESWLSNKKTEIEKQEEIFLGLVQKRISQLIQEFEEEIIVLKKIDVDEKKAEGKVKLIVKENLDNYIYYLEKLMARLKEVGKEKDKAIEKINSIFSDFEKRSKMSYEKATFLIGKEIAKVKESMRAFFKDLNRSLKEHQDLIDKTRIISPVEKKIGSLSEIKNIRSGIGKTILEYDHETEELKKEIEIKEGEIEKIKKTEKFIEQEKKKQELERKKEDLEKEISKLRELISFKALTNFFHSFEKEMAMIEAHKGNFKAAFQKTNGEEILALLQEAKLQNPEILNKIQNIVEKEKGINSTVIEETEVKNLETAIKKIKSEIEVFNSKKLPEEKRYKKLEGNLNRIINSIGEELAKINVKLD